MPSTTIYFPDDKLDLFVWFKSQPKDKKSKMVLSALETIYKSEGKAKPKDIKKALQDKQTAELEEAKAAVMRMFDDVPKSTEKQEREWARECGRDCIRRRLDYVTKKLPETMRKEARFYFMAQFPILAKEAGL